MKNNVKFLVLAFIASFSTSMFAETMYVVSGKCNIPLTAGMNNAKYQLFTWDGTTATATTDISCDPTGTGGSYYNSTSLALSDLKNASKYGTSSTGSRTMQAIKLAGSKTLTITLGSKTMSKVVVVGRANSTDNLTITILGESVATNSKDFFVVEKEQSFTGSVSFTNTTSKEYHFFVYMIEGSGSTPPTPETPTVTSVTVSPATATLDINGVQQLTATVVASPDDADKTVTWTSSAPSVATVSSTGLVTAVAQGTATITATSNLDNTKSGTCTVTVNSAPAVEIPVTAISIKSATTIKVGASETLTVTYTPENANTGKALLWTSFDSSIATVSNTGVVTGVAAGSATIHVSTEGGFSANCIVTVEENTTPVPTTGLTKHEPEIYEAKSVAGGYDGKLRVINGREYEVYYPGKTNSTSYASVCVNPNTQKQEGITTNTSATYTKAKDGWFEGNIAGISNYALSEAEEFEAGATNVMHKMSNNNAYKFHVQGFDQFSIIAKDKKLDTSSDHSKPNNNQLFEVFIDDVVQARQSNASSATIRRYPMTTGEHVIEVRAINSGNSELYGFSLRVAQEPRTKYIKGNDSAQVVMQTQAIKPVVYATKYNNIPGAETRLVWTGAEATGITLTKTSGTLSDTLTLSGVANCPIGTYNYAVVAYYNGQETNRLTGSFSVKSDIKALTDNLNVTVFNTEAMEQIKFRYYALSANDVQLTWGANGQPSGISGNGNNGTYTIGGTPTVSGTLPQTFPYEITVAGADTVYKGAITVKELVHTDKDVLFLYENTGADNTPIYNFLKEKGWNPVERKALSQLRPADQYGYYKWILISEDVNANNPEVLAIARGEVGLPVLNMKSFSYGPDRLDWGEPDNGTLDSVTNNRYNIIVQRADHPIFQKLGWQQGAKKQILSNIDRKGLMPVNVDYDGTLCLATAYTRSLLDYYKDGEPQTFLHEVPASMRNGKKYLCLPIAYASCQYLTNEGKNLLKAAIDYLTSNEATVALPELEITRFAIGDVVGEINQMSNTILVTINEEEHPDWDLAALKPSITLKDPTLTHVSPASGEEENFASSISFPVEYIVSDYINRRIYNVTVRTYSPQGIDEVYTDGEWVNVFDIYGRLIATTNENIYTMSLPRGMYLIVTSGGKTIKLMK